MLPALIQNQHLQMYFSARQSIYSHILITSNLFTQRKAVKRPSNVIWTAICPLLCSIRGSFRGTFPELAVTTVTPVTRGYAPGYAQWKRDHIAFCKFKMLALSLASHLYLIFQTCAESLLISNLPSVNFSSSFACVSWSSHFALCLPSLCITILF